MESLEEKRAIYFRQPDPDREIRQRPNYIDALIVQSRSVQSENYLERVETDDD